MVQLVAQEAPDPSAKQPAIAALYVVTHVAAAPHALYAAPAFFTHAAVTGGRVGVGGRVVEVVPAAPALPHSSPRAARITPTRMD